MGTSTYLIALGSNQRTRWGSPNAALRHLSGHPSGRWDDGLSVTSRIITSRPVGPGRRSFANAVALIESTCTPPELLAHLKQIERAHGRRRGRRWGERPLDLDIIAWSGGMWASPGLSIPHPEFRNRRFVLAPLTEIAADWRDPVTQLTARQLLARLDRKRAKA